MVMPLPKPEIGDRKMDTNTELEAIQRRMSTPMPAGDGRKQWHFAYFILMLDVQRSIVKRVAKRYHLMPLIVFRVYSVYPLFILLEIIVFVYYF